MYISLKKDKVVNFEGVYKHNEKIKATIERNQGQLESLILRHEFGGIFRDDSFRSKFSLSGAFKIKNLKDLGEISQQFLKKIEGRYFVKISKQNTEFHLRGPRYIVALDPKYSVIQKLEILKEDILDCVQTLNQYEFSHNNQFGDIGIILDYLKNGLITLFNSYIHKEKLGVFKLNNKQYQENRKAFLELISISVLNFYYSMVDKITLEKFIRLKETISSELLSKIVTNIKNEFRDYSFSSKSLVRPEASHPLVNFGYSFRLTNKYQSCSHVFGLPSGSTEIACLTYGLLSDYYKNDCKLTLIPISFHSIKDTGRNQTKNFENFEKALSNQYTYSTGQGLVVDDNSASGRTIQQILKTISKVYPELNIIASVAEADLVRIGINIKDANKEYKFSHPVIYKHSCNILPVSRIIRNKFDLRETYERRQLYHYYKNKQGDCIASKIVNEVVADCVENKVEDILESLNKNNAILKFKHTFLSNFYYVPIVYKGRLNYSVEQAYLKEKFNKAILKNLNSSQKYELNDILKLKGIGVLRTDFAVAYEDYNLPAGVLKRWSTKLKSWGYEREDWDSIRLQLMTELLLLKFTDKNLKQKLCATRGKYLVEGNEWNDTFWGVCNKRGRNYLGRILMNIREKLINEEIDKNQLIIYTKDSELNGLK